MRPGQHDAEGPETFKINCTNQFLRAELHDIHQRHCIILHYTRTLQHSHTIIKHTNNTPLRHGKVCNGMVWHGVVHLDYRNCCALLLCSLHATLILLVPLDMFP